MNGKWYLVYTYTNKLEKRMLRKGIEDVEIALKAISEDEAIAEAKMKWKEISVIFNAHLVEEWERMRQDPRNPHVIYKIPIQQEI